MIMGIYDRYIVPRLLDFAMRQPLLNPYRHRVIGGASGRVLEIGIGSGLNLPFYGGAVRSIVGIDPSSELLRVAAARASQTALPIELITASAEALPLETASVDTVVTTWTLCSIPAVRPALAEMRRVLGPTGRLLFIEHGQAPESAVRWWQDRITPIWKIISGGCHLNRPIGEMLKGAGFRIEHLDTGYMGGPRPMTFTYEGSARPG